MTKDLSEATTHPDKVMPSSAVSRWSMDSSEVSSGVISDSWGSNEGTLNGGVTTGASGIGGSEAFSFDGSDDYVDITGGPDTADLSQYTISVWAKFGGYTDDNLLWSIDESGGYSAQVIGYRNSSDTIRFDVGDGSTFVTVSATKPLTGKWTHLVGTAKENGKVKIYKNGVLEDSASLGTFGDSNSHHAIGTQMYNGSPENYHKGDIDEVRIYSSALTQQQIWKLYNIGRNANWGFSRS